MFFYINFIISKYYKYYCDIMVVKIAILRSGNIGTSPILDLLLDERADRPNIDVRVFGSGAKMNPEQVEDVVPKFKQFDPDFCIFISPNPAAPGPARARELLSAEDIPAIIIGDAPGKGKKDEMDEQGLGYIIVMADPMIGAKREWLDPTEMAIFNADIIKVLEAGNEIELPKLIVTAEKAVEAAKFQNPYAKAKAIAAYEMAGAVAGLDMKGCFMTKGFENFIPLVAAAHEMAACAAALAAEAREIEKSNDTVLRTPHMKEGNVGCKLDLISKPE